MAKWFEHTYICTVCNTRYHCWHDDDTLYADSCPSCGFDKNEPNEITEERIYDDTD